MESLKFSGAPFSPIQEYIDVSTTILRELPKKRDSNAFANDLVASTNRSIEERVAERVSKRATKKKEIQLKAEGHKRAVSELQSPLMLLVMIACREMSSSNLRIIRLRIPNILKLFNCRGMSLIIISAWLLLIASWHGKHLSVGP
jgi:hypothetical protein